MTITDAIGIIRGDANAATAYLRRTTESHLLERFQPIVADALQQTGATRLYGEVASAYNLIAPADRTIDPELDRYVTGQAIAGLFTLIAEEEARIRTDPVARTTAAMRQAFR